MPCPDAPVIDEERWIEGNGGVIRFYSQGPVEVVRFPPEGLAAESLIEDWRLRRYYDRGQMSYKLDLVCNRMDFHGIPIDYCEFDLGESGVGRRISGEGTYIGQHIDRHENRIVQIDARSLSIREDGPRSYGPLDIQIGGEAGYTHGMFLGIDRGINSGDYSVDDELKINKKAEELLLSFLDTEQRKSYKKHKFFEHLEKAARREWRFHFRYHYPVEFRNPGDNFIGLCIELENETPKEDVLLMSLLEVRGGRGDEIIKAGHRNPRPLRDDQRLHRGASPGIGVIEFSGSEAELRQFRQRWSEAIEQGRTATRELGRAFRQASISARRFQEQIREERLRIMGLPQQWVSEENRETATEVRDIAPPLTLEQLQRFILNIASTPRITKVSCSSEAYGDLIRRNDIVLNEGVSINIATNDLYIGSLWGIEFYVNPDQREPFRPMEG